MRRRAKPPTGGASNTGAFADQTGAFCPPSAIRNVRPDARRRLAQRPSLRRLFDTQLAGPVRAMAVIDRPAGVSGFRAANWAPYTGFSRASGPISGNIFIVDQDLALGAALGLDSTPYGGIPNGSVAHCDWHPDGMHFAVIANYTDWVTGRLACLVQYRSLATGATLWEAPIADPARDRYGDTVCVTEEYVIVATNEFLHVRLVGDGSLVAEYPIPFAYHAVKVFKNPSLKVIGVAFDGSTAAGMTVGGVPIEPGLAAMQFRAGVAMYHVLPAVALPLGGSALLQFGFGAQLPNTDPWSEGTQHGYWRISEQATCRPRGANVTDACFGPDGSVILLTTNQGIGPNNTYPPDGSAGFVTVRKIAGNGVLAWERNTASILEAFTYNSTTYYCDIVEGTSKDPSVQACAVDAGGQIYVAGRQNAGGQSVFCFDSEGNPLWSTNLVNAAINASVRQAGVAIDPGDNNPVFVFDRNSSWTGSAGRQAIAIKLDRTNGQVLKHLDLGASISALGIAINANRQILLTTDFF